MLLLPIAWRPQQTREQAAEDLVPDRSTEAPHGAACSAALATAADGCYPRSTSTNSPSSCAPGRSGCGAVAEGCDIDLARRGRSKSNNTLYYVRLLVARSLVCEYVCVCVRRWQQLPACFADYKRTI